MNRQGQSTVEMAVLVAVVVAALLAMQIYMKRAAMGKLRESTDQLGEQYEPDKHLSSFTNKYTVTRSETSKATGESTTTIAAGANAETRTRGGGTGSETTTGATLIDGAKVF